MPLSQAEIIHMGINNAMDALAEALEAWDAGDVAKAAHQIVDCETMLGMTVKLMRIEQDRRFGK